MKKRRKASMKQTNRLLVLIAVVISVVVVIYTYVSIKNTDNLAIFTKNIYENSYKVTVNAINYRDNLMKVRTTMYKMVNDPQAPGVDEGIQFLYDSREQGKYHASVISSKYDDYVMDIIDLHVENLRSVHDSVINMAMAGDTQKARQVLETDGEEIYGRIDSILASIVDQGSHDIEFYVSEAQIINQSTNFTALVMGALVIVFAIVASAVGARTISLRNKEIYHREVLFNAITENVDDIFVIYDKESENVEFVSENIERICGMSASEYLARGKTALSSVINTEEFTRLVNMFYDTKAEDNSHEYDIVNEQTGEARTVRTSMHPILDKEGQMLKMVSLTTDITKDIEAQKALEEALTTAQNAVAVRRDFLSRTSHELRTPINAIVGMRTIAEMSLGNKDKLVDCLHKIDVASKYLLELVNDILDMSKIETNNVKLDLRVFNIADVLEKIASIIYPRTVEKNQCFEIEANGLSQKIFFGDEVRIRQVVLNFLTNAVKFAPVGGHVRLEVKQGEVVDGCGYTCFLVYDNGPGIRKEFLDKVFLPFEQDSENMPRSYAGSGLGMAISKNLADMMDGDITILPNPGGGTIFSFNLMLTVPQTDYVSPEERNVNRKIKFDFVGRRALIVEDNEINMEIMVELLKAVGFGTDCAIDGRQAVDIFTQKPEGHYDIIFMDIKMPVLDGYSATKEIRSSGKDDALSVLIVAMSANALPEEIAQGLNSGMNVHLTKPVDPPVMFSSIEALFVGKEDGKKNGKEDKIDER